MSRPCSQDKPPPVIVWQLSDGKRGHLSQSAGLINALARYRSVRTHQVGVPPLLSALRSWVTRRLDWAAEWPLPQVVVGAGHATHLPMLAVSRACGATSVVLMQPSLPLAWFDYCLAPTHDNPPPGDNVITTRGAINTMRPGKDHKPDCALMLIGGHGAHYRFDEAAVLRAARQVLEKTPRRRWVVTNSPRTPALLNAGLGKLAAAEVEVVSWDRCAPGWMAEQLQRAAEVWVTADSVSMIYEALTAGCAVGLLPLERMTDGRVPRAVDALLRRGEICSLTQWLDGTRLKPLQDPPDEADRCARLLLARGVAARISHQATR